MEVVHYLVRRKNLPVGEAIAAGFRARVVHAEREKLVPGALHLIGGLQYGSEVLLAQARERGEPYIFFDRAYFGGGPRSGRYRAVPNAYQHHWVQPGTEARLAQWGVRLEPWSCGGRHILLVPPGPVLCRQFGLGDWEARTLAELHAITRREIRVSYKGDPVPLAERLRDCHAVVTYSSNVAVDAIVAGVPAFCAPMAAAAPVAGRLQDLERDIECPPRPDRTAWACGLAAGQWTVDELRRGAARGLIEEATACKQASSATA